MSDADGTAGRGARYWRARAAQAEADATRLRALVLRLSRALPLEHALLLEREPSDIASLTPASELLLGWDPAQRLERADVDDDLDRLWRTIEPTDEE